MKPTVDTNTIYYVVRTIRKGKFVRAFTTEEQAQRWCVSEKNWTYSKEKMHNYDEQGRVFDIYKKAGA